MQNLDIESETFEVADRYLAQRLYEFNVSATAISDGIEYGRVIRNSSKAIIAGVSGHTWGGTCQVNHLWVQENYRGSGLGLSLMNEVEVHARKMKCTQIVLFTHSFQAPQFYEKLGFKRMSETRNYPIGHSQLQFVKRLKDDNVA